MDKQDNLTAAQIKLLSEVIMEQEQEKAHKAYLREKAHIIANLEGLKVAMKIIAEKDGHKVNTHGVYAIINNTIEFIKKGEV